MAFQLHIEFSGLCMFVPDHASGEMHVLLPDSERHAHDVGRHYTRLFYDEGHKTGGVRTGVRERIPLDRRALLVPRFGAAAMLTLPQQVADVTDFTGKLARSQVGDQPGGVLARVTLSSGRITHCAPGAYWKVGNRFACMTNLVRWTLEVPQNSIELPFAGLNGAGSGSLVELFPIGGELLLEVYNALEADMPPVGPKPYPSPGNGHRADHFAVYYEMFTASPNLQVPVLEADVANCPSGTEDPVSAAEPHLAEIAPTAHEGADP